MLPDVGAGPPLTVTWFVASFLLLGMTLISITSGVVVARYFSKRDHHDEHQDQRLIDCETKIQELQLQAVKRETKHREQVHALQVDILECQKGACKTTGAYVTREEHHGDILRIEGEQKASYDKIMEAIVKIHERIDLALGVGR